MAAFIVQPPKFCDGNWEVYIARFNDYCKVNNWDSAQGCRWLPISLEGKALEAYRALSADVQGDFDRLVAALGQKFAPSERRQVYRLEFEARNLQPGEKLDDLAYDIGVLAKRAFPDFGAMERRNLALARFVDALPDSIRVLVRRQQHVSMEAALGDALNQQAILEVESKRTRRDTNSVAIVDKGVCALELKQSIVDELSAIVRDTVHQMTMTNQRATPMNRQKRSPGPCWRCGQTGHRQASCPWPPMQPAPQYYAPHPPPPFAHQFAQPQQSSSFTQPATAQGRYAGPAWSEQMGQTSWPGNGRGPTQ
jgi:hypothetical protein